MVEAYKPAPNPSLYPLCSICTRLYSSKMQFARLALFVLAAVAGQVASKRIERPDDPSVGLQTNDEMVATYCNHQGNIPAGLYACFRLNGDIRKRMQSADDTVKGFVNAAGNSKPPPRLFFEEVDVNTDVAFDRGGGG